MLHTTVQSTFVPLVVTNNKCPLNKYLIYNIDLKLLNTVLQFVDHNILYFRIKYVSHIAEKSFMTRWP